MKRPARSPRWLIAAFGLALMLFLAFALHALWVVTHLESSPGPVQAWMTPGYIVRSYGIAPEVMAQTLGLDPGSARGKTLEEIAATQGVPLDRLLEAVQAVVPR
ncbi:MAG: hypothetical protein RLZZ413_2130 [Pseudomonadota bacterium]